MLRISLFTIVCAFFTLPGFAQQKSIEGFQWYNTTTDAQQQIKVATAKATKEHKHVLIQVGGNWCIWCKRLHILLDSNQAVHNYLDSNFVLVPLNYSKENKNMAVLERLGYPQRFGFPVLVVLDGKGNRLHTQNSGYLEEGKGHSSEKVLEFLKQWSPAALNPVNYKE
jgi:thioredoxin-related protein